MENLFVLTEAEYDKYTASMDFERKELFRDRYEQLFEKFGSFEGRMKPAIAPLFGNNIYEVINILEEKGKHIAAQTVWNILLWAK